MITLANFSKNEAHCITGMLESAINHVDEVVLVDDNSTDNTIEVVESFCNSHHKPVRIYKAGLIDFASQRTLTAHLAREPWVLMLDADEKLDGAQNLIEYIRYADTENFFNEGKQDYQNINAWAFPRKRWLNLERTKQTELEAWPDYQVRLFRNDTRYVWKRELHEYFHGCAVNHSMDYDFAPVIIDHFHDVTHDEERLRVRKELYTKLAKQARVHVEGGHIIE